MKKTITLPSGQTEVVEGTAEEIAAYERAKREEANESKKSKKKILLAEEEVRKIVREELITHELTRPSKVTIPYIAPVVECQHEYPNPWMSVTPPSCIKCGKVAGWITPYVGDPLPGATTVWSGVVTWPNCLETLDMEGKTIPGAVKVDGCFPHHEPTELDKVLQGLVGKVNSNYCTQA